MTIGDVDWSAVSRHAVRRHRRHDRRPRHGHDRLRARLDQHRRRLVALPAPRRERRGHRRLEHLRRRPRPGPARDSTAWPSPGPTRTCSRASAPTRSAPWPRCCRPGCSCRSSSPPSSRSCRVRSSASTRPASPCSRSACASPARWRRSSTASSSPSARSTSSSSPRTSSTRSSPSSSPSACRSPSWAGIMIADIALRKRDYDDDALFDASGRYGAFDWVSIGTMVVASVLGWGLVVNNFADDATLEQLAGLPARPARPRHVRQGPRRLLLGGHLRLRQPRRPARPRPVVRRHLRRPTRQGRSARRAAHDAGATVRRRGRAARRRVARRHRPAGRSSPTRGPAPGAHPCGPRRCPASPVSPRHTPVGSS